MDIDGWVARHLHMSLDALALLITLAGILITTVTFIVKRSKQIGRRLPIFGKPEAKYLDWFIGEHASYWNPYLNIRQHWHSLERTFIPLHFGVEGERSDAAGIIGDLEERRMVVSGQPGSGKSTMLRQFGVERARAGVQRRGFRRRGLRQRGFRPRGFSRLGFGRLGIGWLGFGRLGFGRLGGGAEVPFLLSLRMLARELDKVDGVAGYIIQRILVERAGLSRQEATVLLRELLAEKHSARCVVLLDGLDEVPEPEYPAVYRAVERFIRNNDPEMPSSHARIIVSCRTHNFRRVRREWLGERALLESEYELAPLRTAEIIRYLTKLNAEGYFERKKDGPQYFLREVRAADALEMHSVPLVLAMSVGLFAPRHDYRIPGSVAKLYDLMINAMLERHSTQGDPQGAIKLRFPDIEDKRRLLRQFAYAAVISGPAFGDITDTELMAFARERAAAGILKTVNEAQAGLFTEEILERSGLLTDTSAGDWKRFVFAHRSIQEHLVAEELRLRRGEGAQTLLTHAQDPEWAQIILFFTAAEDQSYASPFLEELARIDVELAGLCLAAADCLDDVAATILVSLRDRLASGQGLLTTLSALLAAIRSPRPSIQDRAIRYTHEMISAIIGRPDVATALGQNLEGTINLLKGLADAGAATTAPLVPRIARMLPDHPKLVEPLWRTLSTRGLDAGVAGDIVIRLLTLVMDEECFGELQSQEAYEPEFATPEMRQRVYPFQRGAHDRTSNFVTLLAWADHLNVKPAKENRFFAAKEAQALAGLESARRRTLRPSLFWPIRTLSLLSMLSPVSAAIILIDDWRVLIRPWGWWSLILYAGLAAAMSAAPVLLGKFDMINKLLEPESDNNAASFLHVVAAFADDRDTVTSTIVGLVAIFLPPAALVLTFAPLAPVSIALFGAVAILANVVLIWIPLLEIGNRKQRIRLYEPNPYIDIYEDPGTRHWVSAIR